MLGLASRPVLATALIVAAAACSNGLAPPPLPTSSSSGFTAPTSSSSASSNKTSTPLSTTSSGSSSSPPAIVDAGIDAAVSCPTACPGTCTQGGCLVPLASAQDHPSSVAVYDGTVYWTNTGSATVLSISADSRAGGTPVTVATPTQQQLTELDAGSPTSVGPLAVFPPNVYWWATSGVTVQEPEGPAKGVVWEMYAPLAGGAPHVGFSVAGAGTSVGGVAANATATFWAATGDGWILSSAITPLGSTTGEFAQTTSPQGVAVDESNVYWSAVADAGLIMRAGVQQMASTFDAGFPIPPTLVPVGVATLAINQNMPGPLAVYNGSVYWTNLGDGTVVTVGADGGTATPLAAGQIMPYAIAVNASGVYWTDRGGTVMQLVLGDAGALKTLASGQSMPYGIALDDTSVYWTDYTATGDVMKLTPGCGCP